MSNPVVTADELATHLVCPQQYAFAHTSPVSPRDSHQSVVRQRRRELLSETVRAGLTADVASPAERVAVARDTLDSRWRETSRSYLTATQETFDREAIEAAIREYFHGPGERHVETLVATDTVLECPLEDVTYQITVDAVIKEGTTYTALQYVPDLSGVHPTWKDEPVAEYLAGTEFWPRQIGHICRAAIAMKGLLHEYGLQSNQDFAYMALLSRVERAYGASDETEISARPEPRHFRNAYQSEQPEIGRLLKDRGPKVAAGTTEVPADALDKIRENCCEYCAFQDACPEFLDAEISFATRRELGGEPAESADHPAQSEGEQ